MSQDSFERRKQAGYFDNARQEVADLVPTGNGVVLEVGCAAGAMSTQLLTSGRAGAIDGVEIEPRLAAQAEGIVRKLYVGDVDSLLAENALTGPYDGVLVADVLEHLLDPWQTLTNLAGLLSAGGWVVGSIPNVGSIRVVGPLVARGRFDYVDELILDRTHLRFFTESSIRELLEGAGFEVDHMGRRYMGSTKRSGWVPKAARLLGRFGVDQFVFRARLPS